MEIKPKTANGINMRSLPRQKSSDIQTDGQLPFFIKRKFWFLSVAHVQLSLDGKESQHRRYKNNVGCWENFTPKTISGVTFLYVYPNNYKNGKIYLK